MNLLNRFRYNQKGSVAIIFVLTSLLLFTAAGLAIDSWQRLIARDHLQYALDSAVLEAAKLSTNQGERATEVFFFSLSAHAPNLDQSDINATFTIDQDGGMQGNVTANVSTFLLQVSGLIPSEINIAAVAEWAPNGGVASGCIYLTDPSNTGLDMTGNSEISADCTIQIETDATAIRTRGNATASFDAICANGTIDVVGGSLTPGEAILNCTPVLDPFNGLTPPAEASQSCDENDDITVSGGNTLTLAPGVYCGLVEVRNNGTLILDPGIYVFKDELEVDQGATMTGEEVLLVFDRDVDDYTFNGEVQLTGLRSGDFQGFVLYHEDFPGNSNSIRIGPNSDVDMEGVIYIPNTNIRIFADLNDEVSRSIMVTDRLELSGNATFTGSISDTTSETPLPVGGTDVDALVLRLVK